MTAIKIVESLIRAWRPISEYKYVLTGGLKLKERKSRRRIVTIILLGVVLLGFVLLIWLVPHEFYSTVTNEPARTNAEASTRTALIASLAGLAAFAGLFWTAGSYRLSVRGQFTDSFFKAIEQLGSEQLTLRLGGVYALERVAFESKNDHRAVVDILGAFIRNSTRDRRIGSQSIAADVQAAITVLGRLPHRKSVPRGNFSGSKLVGADFRRLDFTEADFSNAVLKNCKMDRGFFRDCTFDGSKIDKCGFTYALLTRCRFNSSHIWDCKFDGAILTNSYFTDSDVQRISLFRAKQLSQSDISAVLEASERNARVRD